MKTHEHRGELTQIFDWSSAQFRIPNTSRQTVYIQGQPEGGILALIASERSTRGRKV